MIEYHHSYNSSSSSAELYRLMFPDSAIAQKFQCGESKAKYITTFGIAPYLQLAQLKAVQASKNYVLLFDESLNHHLQSKQLDTHVRYWAGDEVRSEYVTSQFLGHARADDLMKELRKNMGLHW